MSELAVRGEVVDAGTSEIVTPTAPLNLFGTDEPDAVVTKASGVANALASVLNDKQLFKNIRGKNHVLVEGWTLLGSMLGVFPVCVWTRKLEDGWEARVEARTLSGAIVGAAEAECLRSENRWKSADDYAVRSMAQTRATSKALRAPLGFIVSLAGYNATPAEEMPAEEAQREATPEPKTAEERPSNAQHRNLARILKELEQVSPANPDVPKSGWEWVARDWIEQQFGKRSRTQLTRPEMGLLIDQMEQLLEAERVPLR